MTPEQCSKRRLVHDQAMPVEAIHLGAPRKPELWTVESVRAVAGKGLEGDRHFHADGAASGQALPLVCASVRQWPLKVTVAAVTRGDNRRGLSRAYSEETWRVYEFLDISLYPRGLDSLYEFAAPHLGNDSRILDAGCRNAEHLIEL